MANIFTVAHFMQGGDAMQAYDALSALEQDSLVSFKALTEEGVSALDSLRSCSPTARCVLFRDAEERLQAIPPTDQAALINAVNPTLSPSVEQTCDMVQQLARMATSQPPPSRRLHGS